MRDKGKASIAVIIIVFLLIVICACAVAMYTMTNIIKEKDVMIDALKANEEKLKAQTSELQIENEFLQNKVNAIADVIDGGNNSNTSSDVEADNGS